MFNQSKQPKDGNMISINNLIINNKITNLFQKYKFEVDKVNNNIENIKKFTNILDIENK